MSEIKQLIIGGQVTEVENLSEEQVEYLLTSMNVPENAERVFHESTGALEIKPKTGSKGSDRDSSLRRLLEDLGVPLEAFNDYQNDDDEDEDEDEDEYDYDEDFEDEDFEDEETEEERQEREYLESFAIPSYKFEANDILYFKQNDVDVTNLSDLVKAKYELDQIDNARFERDAKEVARQFVDEDISYDEFKKELGL